MRSFLPNCGNSPTVVAEGTITRCVGVTYSLRTWALDQCKHRINSDFTLSMYRIRSGAKGLHSFRLCWSTMIRLQIFTILLTQLVSSITATPFPESRQSELSCDGESILASNDDRYCRVFAGNAVSNTMTYLRFHLPLTGDALHIQASDPFSDVQQHIQDCANAIGHGSTTGSPIQSFQVYNQTDNGMSYCAFSPSLNCDMEFKEDEMVAGEIYQYNLIGSNCRWHEPAQLEVIWIDIHSSGEVLHVHTSPKREVQSLSR